MSTSRYGMDRELSAGDRHRARDKVKDLQREVDKIPYDSFNKQPYNKSSMSSLLRDLRQLLDD